MGKKRKRMIRIEPAEPEPRSIVIDPNKIKVRGGKMPPPQIAHKNRKRYTRKEKHKRPYGAFFYSPTPMSASLTGNSIIASRLYTLNPIESFAVLPISPGPR